MEWEALVPVLVGAVAATAGGAVQQWWAAKRSDSEWVRNLRFEACVRVLTNYESFTDSLFWMSNEWDPYVHGPKPDPVPDLGESDSRLQTAVDELQILGPPAVALRLPRSGGHLP